MVDNKINPLQRKLKFLDGKPEIGASGRKKLVILNKLFVTTRNLDHKKALTYLNKIVSLAKKLKDKREIVKAYKNIGICYKISGDDELALKFLTRSLAVFKETDDKKDIAHCYDRIGDTHMNKGDFNTALNYFIKAMKLREEINDIVGIADSYRSIGIIFAEHKDFKAAFNYFFKHLKMAKKLDDKNRLALAYSNIGLAHDDTGNYNAAIKYLKKSLNIAEKINAYSIVANTCNTMGVVYCKQKQYQLALKHCLRALEIQEDLGEKHECVSTYSNTGAIYAILKRYDTAYFYFKKCLELAKKIKDKPWQKAAYLNLSELYKDKNDYRQAFIYYRKYHDIERKLFNVEKNKQLAEIRTKYETDKKQKEAEIFSFRNLKLQREIKARQRTEKALKKQRNLLEGLVTERTTQLRALAHELSLVEEKQRRKMATYLHDEVSQKLALAAFKLDALDKVNSTMVIRKEHEEIKKIIDHAAQLTRSLTFEISPPILYEFGLEAAIEWLLRQFSKQHRIPCNFKKDGKPKPLTDDTRILLFQSVREILTNISKHASATGITVSAIKDDNVIRIVVKDDGIGFDTHVLNQRIENNEGFGLFNIKERLKHLKGWLDIESKIGHGTSVEIVAPLQDLPEKTNREI